MPTPAIPDKLYFRIGEVARLAGVETYVLRFWETQFPALRPGKGATGQRLYRRREVELALRVKSLLYDQGFTIAGARKKIKQDDGRRGQAALPLESARQRALLENVAKELRAIEALLEKRR